MLNYRIQEVTEQLVKDMGAERLDSMIRWSERLPESAELRIRYVAEWDNDDDAPTRIPCSTLDEAKALNARRVMYVFAYTWEV